MPRALVTGATGFVGSNLTAHLCQQGWDVRCLVRNKARGAGLEACGAELAEGSLGDRASLDRATTDTDTVFHVAGRIRALNDRQFHEDNVLGTRNVIEACAKKSQPPVTLMVSSLAAGGPSTRGKPRRETDRDQPISAYGRSKLAAELAAASLADKAPLSIIRPPFIFGPADQASLTIFQVVRRTRLHPSPGYRRLPLSIVHVADLCDAMVRIADRGVRIDGSANGVGDTSNGTYYIAAERSISYHELGTLVGHAVGCKAWAVSTPKLLFWLVGGMAEAVGQLRRQPGVLNLDKIREAVAPGWECSDEKLRQELGYLPAASLEERFAETAAWYLEQGWL